MWKAALLALAALLAPAHARAEPPVWTVRDADSEMVLFGTIHVLPPGIEWAPTRLAGALADADDLWFELPMDPATQAEVGDLAARRGLLRPDQSLSQLLSPDGAARLARICAAHGLPPDQFEPLQPWYAEVALAWVMFRRIGADAELGVERQLATRTSPRVERKALETPAEQISLFADAPLAEQVASLEQSLKEIEASPDQLANLVDHWLKGDLDALERDALAPLRTASPQLYERLITARNARWTEELKTRLGGSGRTVVAVGMGHMLGPEGLPARLRALGYSVEGP